MFKIKNFKVELKHLLTVVSAIGMLVSFIISLCSEKKTSSAVCFFFSFAGLVTGMCMEAGVIHTPKVCQKLEIDIEPETEEVSENEDESELVVEED